MPGTWRFGQVGFGVGNTANRTGGAARNRRAIELATVAIFAVAGATSVDATERDSFAIATTRDRPHRSTASVAVRRDGSGGGGGTWTGDRFGDSGATRRPSRRVRGFPVTRPGLARPRFARRSLARRSLARVRRVEREPLARVRSAAFAARRSPRQRLHQHREAD